MTAKPTNAKKAPAKAAPKATPKPEAERDASEVAAHDQGRRARKVAIGRDQAPFGESDPLLKHWQKGWDAEDGLRGTAGPLDNAVVNNPNADQSGAAKVGQAETVTAPKKG